MQKIIQEFSTSFPLNLKFDVGYFYGKEEKIIGGIFYLRNKDDNEIITQFILQTLLGCNGVCVSHGVKIMPNYRGKGYGSMLCKFREDLARDLGYSSMICTVVNGNIPQEKIMQKNGWKIISSFHNKKTGNDVNLFFKKF